MIWLALVVTVGVLEFFFLGDVLTQEFTFSNRPESVQAATPEPCLEPETV